MIVFMFQRLLAKLFDMTKRQSGLLQDALVLLHTDIAMVREGFDQMTAWELEKVYLKDLKLCNSLHICPKVECYAST